MRWRDFNPEKRLDKRRYPTFVNDYLKGHVTEAVTNSMGKLNNRIVTELFSVNMYFISKMTKMQAAIFKPNTT